MIAPQRRIALRPRIMIQILRAGHADAIALRALTVLRVVSGYRKEDSQLRVEADVFASPKAVKISVRHPEVQVVGQLARSVALVEYGDLELLLGF